MIKAKQIFKNKNLMKIFPKIITVKIRILIIILVQKQLKFNKINLKNWISYKNHNLVKSFLKTLWIKENWKEIKLYLSINPKTTPTYNKTLTIYYNKIQNKVIKEQRWTYFRLYKKCHSIKSYSCRVHNLRILKIQYLI